MTLDQELAKLDQFCDDNECTCSETGWEICDSCKVAGFLNQVGEDIRNFKKEMEGKIGN